MSDVSVPAVSGPPMMYPVPPVTPIVGKVMPPQADSDDGPKAARPHGLGQRLDIRV
jgi:hypothetical protein